MTLSDHSLRDSADLLDDAVAHRLLLLRARLEPDPLFRRRLRSAVVNRYVAAREGHLPMPRRRLAAKVGVLGRACLYASLALATSVAGVLAASQESLPGEALYGIKLRIEQLRADVLPSRFHDDLAIDVLTARVDEFGRLAATGDLDQALGLLPAIEKQYALVLAINVTADPTDAAQAQRRLAVVGGLVDRLPEGLRLIARNNMPGLRGLSTSSVSAHDDDGRGGPAPATGDDPPAIAVTPAPVEARQRPAPPARHDPPVRNANPEPIATPQPTASPDPTPTAEPTRTPKPERTPSPTRSPEDDQDD